jgi:TRAP-type C4-dicarboxylate transport system permease small subunit
MIKKVPMPNSARIAIAALAVLGHVGGWLIMLDGGFSHTAKFSKEMTRVEGVPAWAMAAIVFVMGTIAIAALLQSAGAGRKWYWLVCGFALVAPAAYLFFF